MSIIAISIGVNRTPNGDNASMNYILDPAVCPFVDDPCVGTTGRVGPSTRVATATEWSILNDLVATTPTEDVYITEIESGQHAEVVTTAPAFPNGMTINIHAVNGQGEIYNWPTESAAETVAPPETLNPNFPDDGQLHFQNWDDRNRAFNAGALHGEHGFPKLTGIGTYQADYDRAYDDAYRTWYPIFNHGPRARTM